MYTVARSGHLSFFKDHKGYKSNPELTFRGEPVYDLQKASVEIASDYTKKKHVLRIKYVTKTYKFFNLLPYFIQ